MNFSARKKLPFEWNCRGVLVLYGLRGSSILLNTSNFNTKLFGFLHTVPSISETLIEATRGREEKRQGGRGEVEKGEGGRARERTGRALDLPRTRPRSRRCVCARPSAHGEAVWPTATGGGAPRARQQGAAPRRQLARR